DVRAKGKLRGPDAGERLGHDNQKNHSRGYGFLRIQFPGVRENEARTHYARSFLQIHRLIRWSRWPQAFLRIGATAAAREHRRRTRAPLVTRWAEDEGAVAGRRDGGCAPPHSAGTTQPLALRPVTAAAGEHPRRADAPIVVRSADHDDAAVGGKRD